MPNAARYLLGVVSVFALTRVLFSFKFLFLNLYAICCVLLNIIYSFFTSLLLICSLFKRWIPDRNIKILLRRFKSKSKKCFLLLIKSCQLHHDAGESEFLPIKCSKLIVLCLVFNYMKR